MAVDGHAIERTLTAESHRFLQPTLPLYNSFLDLAKQYLDPLADDISNAQQQRLKQARQDRKRKRLQDDDGTRPTSEILRMKQIHVNGFATEQIWEQARRVLDAAADEVDREAGVPEDEEDAHIAKAVRFEDDLAASDEDLGEEGVDYDVEGLDDEDDDGASQASGLDEEGPFSEEDEDEDADSQTSLSGDDKGKTSSKEEFVKDQFGLNDGFFSIDQFNKHSEFLERQDAKGDPDDGAASDEEEVDWTLDPLGAGAKIGTGQLQNPAKRGRSRNEDGEDDDDDDDGPTFGDADLNAPDTEDDDDDDDETGADLAGVGDDFGNTNDILYADFFAPPARQKGQNERRQRQKPPAARKPTRLAGETDEDLDEDDMQMQRAMADVQRDLLDDEEPDLDSSSERDSPASPSRPQQNLSSHEQRMLAFQQEIKRLERENLANKEWSLLGESVAPARPENALLEEDLDFERAGKPVPIATAEVNESIEDLIKRRVLANDFDTLTRRRPELADGNTRSKPPPPEELSDAKPTRGLAAEYEDAYLRATDANYIDAASEAVQRARATIAAQWRDVSAQLDALSNYHYKPRPPEQSIEVRTDAPVISMEEARPTAGADASASGLAPHEVYRPGGRAAGEIVTKGGTAVAREEDSRESKRRRRRRDKARARKAGAGAEAGAAPADGADAAAGAGAAEKKKKPKKADKEAMLKSLRKGNVKVIGKKGELEDVQGNAASVGAQGRAKASDFML